MYVKDVWMRDGRCKKQKWTEGETKVKQWGLFKGRKCKKKQSPAKSTSGPYLLCTRVSKLTQPELESNRYATEHIYSAQSCSIYTHTIGDANLHFLRRSINPSLTKGATMLVGIRSDERRYPCGVPSVAVE
jgi:hypothetical protein